MDAPTSTHSDTMLRRSLMAYGIALMIGGLLSLALPNYAGIAVGIVIGTFFVITGIISLCTGVMVPLAHRYIMIIIGLVEIAFGGLILVHPSFELLTITAYIGIAFIFQGGSRMLLIRRHGRVEQHFIWFLAAFATLLVGIIFLATPPSTGWIVGTLAGASLLFHGLSVTCSALQHPALETA